MFFFFFNDTATTEIYTLALHDALPIFISIADAFDAMTQPRKYRDAKPLDEALGELRKAAGSQLDRKSTRLNSSHANISYAVFCLKKKKFSRPNPNTESTYYVTCLPPRS